MGAGSLAAGLLLAVLLGGCGGVELAAPPAVPVSPAEAAGIRVTAVRMSGAGRIVDFRFRVIDAEKARALLGQQLEVYALDQATGTKLPVPSAAKIGALRQTARGAVEGKIYFVLFGNTNRVVAPGSRLTVVLGDLRLPDLVVQ